jgi:hypothetical protein
VTFIMLSMMTQNMVLETPAILNSLASCILPVMISCTRKNIHLMAHFFPSSCDVASGLLPRFMAP